ncbi:MULTISPECIES: type II toxin-antitoxin system antitoxin SocA domain-containing protein [Bacteria]|uniref:type II toxin-antitoxin system antitoxin SocA domain-containing protein n=1 Tax=Bacteria TaxID=2 RepID=UPI0032EE7CE7
MPVNPEKFKYLSNQHIEVVDTVISKFKYFNAKQISDYSHEESAYTNTNHNEPISYEYALELQPI